MWQMLHLYWYSIFLILQKPLMNIGSFDLLEVKEPYVTPIYKWETEVQKEETSTTVLEPSCPDS